MVTHHAPLHFQVEFLNFLKYDLNDLALLLTEIFQTIYKDEEVMGIYTKLISEIL